MRWRFGWDEARRVLADREEVSAEQDQMIVSTVAVRQRTDAISTEGVFVEGERLVEILTQTVAAELDRLGRDLWAQRLGDAAWVMHQNQCGDEAAQVLAVRDQLLSTETPSDLAFFRQMVGRLLLGRLPQDVAAQLIPGLPGETPPPETKPPSGLIIPGR